jgi:hypothetical protein
MKKKFIIFHYLTSFVNDDEQGNGQRNNDKSKIPKKRNPIFGFVISQDQKMDSYFNNNKTKNNHSLRVQFSKRPFFGLAISQNKKWTPTKKKMKKNPIC